MTNSTHSPAEAGPGSPRISPFTGEDLCATAGFRLPPGATGPQFDDDLWSFTDVIGVARYVAPSTKIIDFTVVPARWRRLAKEYIAARLLPHHEAVAVLPHAFRNPLNLASCRERWTDLTGWLTWLDRRGVTSLREVGQRECDAFVADARNGADEDGQIIRGGPKRAATIVIQTVMYSELFTDDSFVPDFRPFNGQSVYQMFGKTVRGENKTPPVQPELLQPLLAAALYVVDALGPQVAVLRPLWKHHIAQSGELPSRRRLADHLDGLKAAVRRHVEDGSPLQSVRDSVVRHRLLSGWSPEDPLLKVAFGALAREIGLKQLQGQWWEEIRAELQAAVEAVGVAPFYARDAPLVARADGRGDIAWTEPLNEREVRHIVATALTASILVVVAVSGMRHSELAELDVGCRRTETIAPDRVRHRLAGKVIKGQPLGGTPDEWVVVPEVHQAVALAEQLIDNAVPGAPLFGRISFNDRYTSFREWVNGPAGQRLGLQPIPDGELNMRMLRRTLAIELAYRPAGMLAAKIHLKHVSVATTEGYAGRPGGAQARLLAEIGEHEQERNLELLFAEWRNYQGGVLPAGPGARELADFFDSVDGQLTRSAPKIAATEQEVRSLLTKRASVLHLGTANYCWFSDPAKALCLKLAGTPKAERPLIGMCDSARCPQATHHPCHRPVWADAVEKNSVFLGGLGATRKTERQRLQVEVDRAARVVAAIDAATGTSTEGAS